MADLKRHEELVVITKTYDLILWSCNHTGKFPRNHGFVLGERIERNLYDLPEGLRALKEEDKNGWTSRPGQDVPAVRNGYAHAGELFLRKIIRPPAPLNAGSGPSGPSRRTPAHR